MAGGRGAGSCGIKDPARPCNLTDCRTSLGIFLFLSLVKCLEDGLGVASMMRGRGRNRPAVQNREVQEYRKRQDRIQEEQRAKAAKTSSVLKQPEGRVDVKG